MRTRERFLRSGLLAMLLPASWLAMQVVHELGHVLHARVTGGTIRQVVLHPLDVSRTEFLTNPWPQFTAWGGVLWGSALPLLAWWLARTRIWSSTHLFRFFAGFCLVANGVYFVIGTIDLGADPGDLVRFGAPRAAVGLAGAVCAALGLAVWHGLGPAFGAGDAEHETRPAHVSAVAVALATMVVLEVAAAGSLAPP